MTVDIHEVARIYIDASSQSRRPLKAVSERFGVSQSTATRRVAEARRKGLIPIKLPTVNPYVYAICEDLGITVESFESAVRRHAPDGNLRVQVGKNG